MRTDDRDLDRDLRLHLEPFVVPSDGHRPNLSVQPAATRSQFHRITWGRCTAVRTRDLYSLVQGLDRHIGGHQTRPHGTVRFRAVAAVGDAGAVLLPESTWRQLAHLQRRLRAVGLEVVNAPWADVDPSAGDVVVTDPDILDRAALVRSLAGRPHVDEPRVAAGRYPIRGWVLPSWTRRGAVEPGSAAVLIVNEMPSPQMVEDVRAAVALANRVPLTLVSPNERSGVVDAAEAALGAHR